MGTKIVMKKLPEQKVSTKYYEKSWNDFTSIEIAHETEKCFISPVLIRARFNDGFSM